MDEGEWVFLAIGQGVLVSVPPLCPAGSAGGQTVVLLPVAGA